MIFLCLILEVGNLWLARAELEDGLESASLAAVKEWAERGGSDTLVPRQIGDIFANSNSVRRESLTLTTVDPTLNYAPGNPNGNRVCPDGVLLFGAITDTDPLVILDTTRTPSCSAGELLFDVSDGNLGQPKVHAWGINFRGPTPGAPLPLGLRVDEIVYDLRRGTEVNAGDPGDDAVFDLLNNAPVVSDLVANSSPAPIVVSPPCVATQADSFGVDSGPLTQQVNGNEIVWFNSQVRFVWNTQTPWILRLQFPYTPGDPANGNGFEPGDRIRFGASVLDLGRFTGGGSAAEDEGDAVGRARVKVTATFAIDGNPLPNGSFGYFTDSDFGRHFANPNNPNATPPPADIDCRSLSNYPYVLPPPPARGNNNDDQSYVRIGAVGGDPFAVRALAQWRVEPLCNQLFGICAGPFWVQAEATAMYDCDERTPRLIRIDRIICP